MLASSGAVAATSTRAPAHTSPDIGADGRSPAVDARRCFHCGEPNPESSHWHAVVDGADRRFCCAGCRGVAQAVRAAGLERFYRYRETVGRSASDAEGEDEVARSADAAEGAGLVTHLDPDLRETSLLIEGIHCGACIWLVESYLARHPGVAHISVNFATRRARVRWDSRRATLAGLLREISAIGYRAHPYDPARREALMRRESRALLARGALALLAMMQVMMFALPGYVSADGVEPEYRKLLDWASLVLTLPVVLYSATPFFAGAWRGIRHFRLGMDVPVALGIGGAFVASVWSTVGGGGAVYYDSVTMFVALLLSARLFELHARRRAGDAIEAITHDLPETAERVLAGSGAARTESVLARCLKAGDLVRVAAGASIPADGVIVDGRSSVEEAVLTGESWPRSKTAGDRVLAGSINRESPLVVRVDAAGEATTLAALVRLVERAADDRPRLARLADRVAQWFVAALLVIAFATGLAWWHAGAAHALMLTLTVLVVSCPCALSLATPAAVAVAASVWGRQRVFAVRGDALESLARVTHVVFDKTGTLTNGRLRLSGVEPLAQHERARCVAIAAALEVGCAHPIAYALQQTAAPAVVAHDVVAVPGIGIEGVVAGRRYRIGRPGWVGALHRKPLPAFAGTVAPEMIAVALGDESGWLAWLAFDDVVRPGARQLVEKLQAMGLAVSLLSGDRSETVRHVAAAVGIAKHRGDAQPEDKRAHIAALQREGAVVAMVGDGINDAPSLAQANVSLSFGSAATLAQWTADVVLLADDLPRIADVIASARRTLRVIRQNLAWAFGYNLLAIPLAASGHLTPFAAALGMSVSSLLVVANALRLWRADPPHDEAAAMAPARI